MPGRAAKVCSRDGCNVLVYDGSSRCPLHKKQSWEKRPNATKRRRGRWLTKERRRLFADNPLCVHCAEKGIVTLATIRDHVVPLEEGGLDILENTQPLCEDCHDIKSAEEAKRGKR